MGRSSLVGESRRRGKLHRLVEKVPLLFLENLSKVFIQGKEGGGHSGLSHKLVHHRCTSECANNKAELIHTEAEERQARG